MWVLSGAGGSVAAARSSGSTARSRSSIVWRNWRSGLARPGASFAEQAQLVDLLELALHRAAADDRCVAERLEGGRARRGERAQARQEGARGSARRPRGRAAPASGPGPASPSWVAYGWSSPRKAGRSRNDAASASRRLAAVSAVRPASRTKRLTSLLRASSAPITRSASVISDLIVLVWRPRMRSVSLVSRRPGRGAPDGVVEVVRAPGQAGAELADDQAQAVAVGPAQDVVDEVEPDRRGGLADRHAPAVGQPARRRARLAVDEVLADERLRADLAAARPSAGRPGPARSPSASTTASGCAWPSRWTSPVLPARTPAILKSPPLARPKALSSTIS